MISEQQTLELVKKFGKGEKDTGSTATQIAILTKKINGLKDHFAKHVHDFHSNRGLLKMIGRRRSLLRYYKNKNEKEYRTLIAELGLRK